MTAPNHHRVDIDWALQSHDAALKDEWLATRSREASFVKLRAVIDAVISENDLLKTQIAALKGSTREAECSIEKTPTPVDSEERLVSSGRKPPPTLIPGRGQPG